MKPLSDCPKTVPQESYDQDAGCLSVLVLVIAKDNGSWGRGRTFVDFLQLLTNLTLQAFDVRLSLGVSISDAVAYADLR